LTSHVSRFTFYWAAFLAGLIYAFSSSKLFYAALGQFNIASSQWIPFTVLYVLRSGRPGARLREPLLAALFLLLQAYAELTYASFLVIFIGLFAGYRVVQVVVRERKESGESGGGRGRRELVGLVRNLTVMALVFTVGLTPVLANMLPDMRAEGDFLVEGGGFADIFSADLAGFSLPTQLHPLLGGVVRDMSDGSALRPDGSQWQVDKGQHLTLGLAGLALAVIGLAVGRRRGAWLWALSAALFFLLALGPSLRIAGYDTGLPGPFRILQELPFFKGNRYPSRFSVMLLVSVAPLVALGAQWLLARLAAVWQRRHDARGVQRRLECSHCAAGRLADLREPVDPPANGQHGHARHLRRDRGRAGRRRGAGPASGLAQRLQRLRQAGPDHHVAAVVADPPRPADAGRQHLAQPGAQVPLLPRGAVDRPVDRAGQRHRRQPAHPGADGGWSGRAGRRRPGAGRQRAAAGRRRRWAGRAPGAGHRLCGPAHRPRAAGDGDLRRALPACAPSWPRMDRTGCIGSRQAAAGGGDGVAGPGCA
jgi:hypothetical protein